MADCIYIPNGRNSSNPSKLFMDLNRVIKDREIVKNLWGIAQSDVILKELKLAVGVEPTAKALLDALNSKNLKNAISDDAYVRYVSFTENLDENTDKDYVNAKSLANSINNKYNTVKTTIAKDGKNYKVVVLKNNNDAKIAEYKLNKKEELNDELLKYMRKLGFNAYSVEGLNEIGMFSPLDAFENADGLINIIKLAKGKEAEALPEEFAHFVVEGYSNHPLVKRLMDTLNSDIVEEILGDEFEEYSKRYNNNQHLLKKEAIGKLIAQKLVDRSNINSKIKYISDRFLNDVSNTFSKGDERQVNSLKQSILDDIDKFVESLNEKDTLDFFDKDAILKAEKLFKIKSKVRNIEQTTQETIETLAKRIKLLNLYKKDKENTKSYKILREINEHLEREEYKDSIIKFLSFCLTDLEIRTNALKKHTIAKNVDKLTENPLRAAAKQINEVETVIQAYLPIIKNLQSISTMQHELIEEDVDEIEKLAKEVSIIMSSLENITKDAKYNVLYKFYEPYFGEDKKIKIPGFDEEVGLDVILQSTVGDAGFMSVFVNAMSDSTDVFLQLVDVAYKDQIGKRDAKLFELNQRIGAINKEYYEATGSRDTSFMYELDENGKPNGWIKSEVDRAKYLKAKKEEEQRLKAEGLSDEEFHEKMKEWKGKNLERVKVEYVETVINNKGKEEKITKTKYELRPKAEEDLYLSDNLKNLTDPQKKYYDAMMKIKLELDFILPDNKSQLHKAVQKRISTQDAVLQKGNLKSAFENWKRRFYQQKDDTDFGESSVNDKGQYVVRDLAGKPIKKIPVFFTTMLDDMNLLDTNFTDSLLSYGAMSYNYESMTRVVDFMLLSRSQMVDREVIQQVGNKNLFTAFKIVDKKYTKTVTAKGEFSKLLEKLDDYIDANIYGIRKNKEVTHYTSKKTVDGKEVTEIKELNYGKLGDAVISYNSKLSLGYNVPSAIVNMEVGILQVLNRALSKDGFSFKNLKNAHKQYGKLSAEYLAEQYSDVKKGKLSLLLQEWDVLEDYFASIDSSEFNQGVFRKTVGKISPLVLHSMGEHYLRSICMLAYLDGKKVKDGNDKEISLYDAIKIEEFTNKDGKKAFRLKIPDDIKTLDGKNYTSNEAFRDKLRMKEIMHKSLSNFSEEDKGKLHRMVAGRFIANFRQWMPKFFTERLKSGRYNMLTDSVEEGYYNTFFNYIRGVLADLLRLNFNFIEKFNDLTPNQKRNIWLSVREFGFVYIMQIICVHLATRLRDDDDEENGGWKLFFLTQLRTINDLKAGIPGPGMYDSLENIIRSPVAAQENMSRIINVLTLDGLTDTIESGRFKDWNKWIRNVFYAVPYVKNTDRLINIIKDGDSSLMNPYID